MRFTSVRRPVEYERPQTKAIASLLLAGMTVSCGSGSVELGGTMTYGPGGSCGTALAPAKYFRDGEQVRVVDGAGLVLAVGAMGEGTEVSSTGGMLCIYYFNVRGVPKDEAVYGIATDSLPTPLYVDRAQLEADGWQVDLSVQ